MSEDANGYFAWAWYAGEELWYAVIWRESEKWTEKNGKKKKNRYMEVLYSATSEHASFRLTRHTPLTEITKFGKKNYDIFDIALHEDFTDAGKPFTARDTIRERYCSCVIS